MGSMRRQTPCITFYYTISLPHASLPLPPGRNATWSVTPYLSTLTRLSLARWPVPTLTSPFKFRTTSKRQGRRPSSQLHFVTGNPGFQSNSSAISLSEAADVLRRLSKATYCPKWLDVEDCHDWLKALVYDRGEDGPDWTGAWRAIGDDHLASSVQSLGLVGPRRKEAYDCETALGTQLPSGDTGKCRNQYDSEGCCITVSALRM